MNLPRIAAPRPVTTVMASRMLESMIRMIGASPQYRHIISSHLHHPLRVADSARMPCKEMSTVC